MAKPEQYRALQDDNPWEDSGWIPANANLVLPEDALSRLMLETPVRDVAIQEPVFIGPDDTLARAIFRMRQRRVRALLVLESGALVGIITDRDMVRTLNAGESGSDRRVRDVMTPDPITAHPDDSVGKAAQRLLEGIHHLPLVDAEGRVVGIVAAGRVLHAIIGELLRQERPAAAG